MLLGFQLRVSYILLNKSISAVKLLFLVNFLVNFVSDAQVVCTYLHIRLLHEKRLHINPNSCRKEKQFHC